MRIRQLLSGRPPWRRLVQSVPLEDKLKLFKVMGYEPHVGQMPIHESTARVRTIACGRRFGKSMLSAAEVVAAAVLGGGCWCVAPDYELSSIVFEQALKFVVESELASQLAYEPRLGRGRQRIIFKSGGWILGKSSHKPRSLLGWGLDLISFDEAATEANPLVWTQHLRPTLLDRQGSILFPSTPRGDDWFKELFDKGQQGVKGYASWQMPTSVNPIPGILEEVRELANDMPEDEYRQEILAQFIDAAGAVFRGYNEVLTVEEMLEGPEGGDYVMGVDLARHKDFTVVTVMDGLTGRAVYGERFNKMDWETIEDRILAVATLFQAPMLVDSTGVGDRVVSALQNRSEWPVEGYHFNNLRKINLIRQFALAIANQEIELFSKDCIDSEGRRFGYIYAGELGAFRYHRSEAGTLKMEAPKGRFDDCVISGALAYEAAKRFTGLMPRASASTMAKPSGNKVFDEIMLDPPSEDDILSAEDRIPGIKGDFGRPPGESRFGNKSRRRRGRGGP